MFGPLLMMWVISSTYTPQRLYQFSYFTATLFQFLHQILLISSAWIANACTSNRKVAIRLFILNKLLFWWRFLPSWNFLLTYQWTVFSSYKLICTSNMLTYTHATSCSMLSSLLDKMWCSRNCLPSLIILSISYMRTWSRDAFWCLVLKRCCWTDMIRYSMIFSIDFVPIQPCLHYKLRSFTTLFIWKLYVIVSVSRVFI